MALRFLAHWSVLLAALLILSTEAQAQTRGNPDNGLKLARQWCTPCHVVEPAGRGGDAGPPFIQVANRPDRTAQTLRAWLNDPHPPMPNLGLSGREVDDIAVYIESLQGRL
ncbi:MAG TPA: cytochrome c [Alphaproteobacteria bacterium]|jgi:mono/diheme cytochrome c family protein|nr:cytochrome c [Alphaproteobacteria bacterium]